MGLSHTIDFGVKYFYENTTHMRLVLSLLALPCYINLGTKQTFFISHGVLTLLVQVKGLTIFYTGVGNIQWLFLFITQNTLVKN